MKHDDHQRFLDSDFGESCGCALIILCAGIALALILFALR